MCGIVGAFRLVPDAAPVSADTLRDAADLLRHRGPDAAGYWEEGLRVRLAHRRLSVLDLTDAGGQPFVSTCGNYVLVYNGEIYNYRELRDELRALGHDFRSSSDTEVLLQAYVHWGPSCVSRFNGDWAFAIYERISGRLFCSRDRFGVKPFVYAIVGGQLLFASEIKAVLHCAPFLVRPNLNVIANYLRNSLGAQHRETWFEGVLRLPPGHNLIAVDGSVKLERYWTHPESTVRVELGEATAEYRRLFVDSVRLRMRSDVPVGTTLSSGIDSGSIVSALRTFYQRPHDTFTAVFDHCDFASDESSAYTSEANLDEWPLVARLAGDLDLTAHRVRTNPDQFIEELWRVVGHLESGHSSPAVVPLSRLYDRARQRVTVVLEGQGADELLGGYVLKLIFPLLGELAVRGRLLTGLSELAQFRSNYSLAYAARTFLRTLNSSMLERAYQRYTGLAGAMGPLVTSDYHRIPDYGLGSTWEGGVFNSLLRRSHAGGLVNLLHYGDALSMAHSVESRLPFLDYRLVEFVCQLPFDFKMRQGMGKYVHRLAMNGVLSEYILWNRLKFGFNTPVSRQFVSADATGVRILTSDRCLARGVLDPDGLRAILDAHARGKRDFSTPLFRMLSTEMWFRRFVDGASALEEVA